MEGNIVDPLKRPRKKKGSVVHGFIIVLVMIQDMSNPKSLDVWTNHVCNFDGQSHNFGTCVVLLQVLVKVVTFLIQMYFLPCAQNNIILICTNAQTKKRPNSDMYKFADRKNLILKYTVATI